MRTLPRLRSVSVALGVALAVSLTATGVGTIAATPTPDAGPPHRVAPISHEGRWLTDETGRVLLIHGVNLVSKTSGETPAQMGFDSDDAEWIVENGFDVVRLGTTAASIMPAPGVIDTDYLASYAQTAQMLTDHGLLVLVDLHQDGWGPEADGESLGHDGFPDWMTLTRGEENTQTDFPLYYVTNPAIQAAFQSFWDDDEGPDGPLQDSAARIWQALAGAVADNPGVIGYDLLNEPWPGFDWQDCTSAAGCPVQDAVLDAFNARMTAAVRSRDQDRLVFGEPYVLFNFGRGPTHIGLPGGDPASGLSWHLYTENPDRDPDAVAFAEAWSARTGGALFATEFGAVWEPEEIDRLTGVLDGSLMPWIWWAYNEQIIRDTHEPPAGDNLNDAATIDAIVRPHPSAVAGTPVASSYDPVARNLQFTWSTDRVGGGSFAAETVSEFRVTERTYPRGYQVAVNGGHVVPGHDASRLAVAADPGSGCVTVAVAPNDGPAPVAPAGLCDPDDVDMQDQGPAPQRPTAAPADPVAARPAFTG